MVLRMLPCVLYFCILVLFVVDTGIGALTHSNGEARQCHQCSNVTSCERLSSVKCSPDKPYCATSATGPNFTSSLGCHAAQDSPCVLEHNTQYVLTCICDDNLCNAPYNQHLRNELLNFSANYPTNSDANLTEMFFKFIQFANASYEAIYETVTDVKTTISTLPTTQIPNLNTTRLNASESLPRAEALKQEGTVSPDDEDDSEGSGTSDDTRVNEHASPAAPSSYLPAKDNAPILSLNISFIITILSLHWKL